MNNEQWKPVANYVGIYEVSDLGRVRSVDRVTSNGKRISGKILSPAISDYARILLLKDKKRVAAYVHILVADAFVGKRIEGHVVNHIDGNKLNNSASNLEYVTQKENIHHAIDSRLITYKLTLSQMNKIRYLHVSGNKDADDIANEFGISRGVVVDVLMGKRYAYGANLPNVFRGGLGNRRKRAEEIRRLYRTGQYSLSILAEMYGISPSAISKINSRGGK